MMYSLRCAVCLGVVDYFNGILMHVYLGPHNHVAILKEEVLIDDHHQHCPCDDTAHTCTNLMSCRWCICERLRLAEIDAVAAVRQPGRVKILVDEAYSQGYDDAFTDLRNLAEEMLAKDDRVAYDVLTWAMGAIRTRNLKGVKP